MHAVLRPVAGGLLITLAVGALLAAREGAAASPTQGGLVFRVGRVICLSFGIDAGTPLHEAHLVIDGKEVKRIVLGQGSGVAGPIKLAIINPVPKEQLMQVYFEADHLVEYMSGQYATQDNAFSGRQIFYGVSSNLTLNGWTAIYRFSELRQRERHEATIEIR